MAMITDVGWALQAIRLTALRASDDPVLPRIVSLDPSYSLNPYINASGLADTERWPEIRQALDSPPLAHGFSVDEDESGRGARSRRAGGGGGLQYTQTIMGPGRTGGAGMRVSGRTALPRALRRHSLKTEDTFMFVTLDPISPGVDKTPTNARVPSSNPLYPPPGRPRADSAPIPMLLENTAQLSSPALGGTSMLTSGRGLGATNIDPGTTILEHAMTVSQASAEADESDEGDDGNHDPDALGISGYDAAESSYGMGESARPSDMGLTIADASMPLDNDLMDEGSDVDEDELEDALEGIAQDGDQQPVERKNPYETDSRRTSAEVADVTEALSFTTVPITDRRNARPSALTAALNKHVPHLVSTSASSGAVVANNPFSSLYTSASIPSGLPSLSLELFFPHSTLPAVALPVKVRKDATVEEVTGLGLLKYWEEARRPLLSAEESEQRWSTIGWGLRIVEDDGEVDEDFPPLDRDSQISKFSYGQFAVVEATESQSRSFDVCVVIHVSHLVREVKQNITKAPHIQRRPSRIIANPGQQAKPSVRGRPKIAQLPAAGVSTSSLSSIEQLSLASVSAQSAVGTMKGSVGLSSALSKPVLLRVQVNASADVHFTTTISVPSDMYIADLTEVLCKRKRLQMPSSDWVLCLGDLTLALPLDRTVASLEGRINLALVRRQWAMEHGLRPNDRRGGDPSASIFKRNSEPAPAQRFGPALQDISQAYKKYTVQRKIAIGRHERVLAIDGDYIHIMPSESRAFFDSMKTTSFHITLVASCKLSGRAGGFKINVWREGGQKRYEFEAENGRQAAEIISSIRGLMRAYQQDRNSVMSPPRPAPSSRR